MYTRVHYIHLYIHVEIIYGSDNKLVEKEHRIYTKLFGVWLWTLKSMAG